MTPFPTVIDAFINSVESKPDAIAIHVIDREGETNVCSYASLYGQSCQVAAGYHHMGLKPGETIVIALSASGHFYPTYLGALFFGAIPLIVLPASAGRSRATTITSINSSINKIGAKLLVVSGNTENEERWSCRSCTPEALRAYSSLSPNHINPNAIAHLQCTSGSTQEPKLVMVRHRNIAANVLGIGQSIKHQPNDRLVSWLPLSHDMGLIGISYALGWQCPLISSDTARFIRNPMSWLHMIYEHKGTLSAAPNSAFLACARLGVLRQPTGINLSTWRVALCGSEPVQETTIAQFSEVFSQFGFRPEAMRPVYGLAEATLAVTIPLSGIKRDIDGLNIEAMVSTGRIEIGAITKSKPKSPGLVALGTILPKHQIRIVDAEGNILPEKTIGEIELSGPSITDGYWCDEEASREIFKQDGYLRTGDLGFLLDSQLYITGRKKDVIIIGGRNFAPTVIEQTVADSLEAGFIKACVAIGMPCKKTGTEILHLIIGAKPFRYNSEKIAAEVAISETLLNSCAISGVTIHWVGRDVIPYTTSGKVQRYLCKQIIEV